MPFDKSPNKIKNLPLPSRSRLHAGNFIQARWKIQAEWKESSSGITLDRTCPGWIVAMSDLPMVIAPTEEKSGKERKSGMCNHYYSANPGQGNLIRSGTN